MFLYPFGKFTYISSIHLFVSQPWNVWCGIKDLDSKSNHREGWILCTNIIIVHICVRAFPLSYVRVYTYVYEWTCYKPYILAIVYTNSALFYLVVRSTFMPYAPIFLSSFLLLKRTHSLISIKAI